MAENIDFPPQARVTGEHILDSRQLIDKMLSELGVHAKGTITSPEEGLIASNFFIDTAEKGPLVLRINEMGEDKHIGFETKALDFLSKHHAPVPTLIHFLDGSLEKRVADKRIVAYTPIEGTTLNANELDDPKLAHEAGSLLNRVLTPAASYEPSDSDPDGDIVFIKEIVSEFLIKYPDLVETEFFKNARTFLDSDQLAISFNTSPAGIVHADYFFENIIRKDGKLVGVIDFGDAYYGALLNDVAIGAMEFSVLEENEEWKPELFEAFLRPNGEWLKQNMISFDIFRDVLIANCIRFAVYTLGFERDENPRASADDNRYIQRYFKFQGPLEDQIRKSYDAGRG